MKLLDIVKRTRPSTLLAIAAAGYIAALVLFWRSCVERDDADASLEQALRLTTSTPVVSNGLPVFSVKTYGAVGNGSTDDRAAVQAALAAACAAQQRAIVFFPGGTYALGRNGSNAYAIDVPCGDIVLAGVHGKSTLLQATAMPNAQVVLVRVDAKSNVTFRDLIVDGNWQNAATYISPSSNNVLLPQSTINVVDGTDFPVGGGKFKVLDNNGAEPVVCTGKTATTLTGCSGGTGRMFDHQVVGYVDAQAGLNHSTQAAAVTTIASGSNGATLPQSTINVSSSSSFSSNPGSVWISTSLGYQEVTCTSKASGQLTSCTGGTGTLSTGAETFAGANPQNHLIALSGADSVALENVQLRRAYGDCVWMGESLGGDHVYTRNVRVAQTDCTMAARNAFTLGGPVVGFDLSRSRSTFVLGQALAASTSTFPTRDVTVSAALLGSWWNRETHDATPLSIVGGHATGTFSQSDAARNWRVHDSTIDGGVLVARAVDVVLSRNRIQQQFARDTGATVEIRQGAEDVTLFDNYVYTRAATTGAEGDSDTAAIAVVTSATTGGRIEPTSIRISSNHIHAHNARSGISILAAGGTIGNATGTASSTSSTTMTDSGASWTSNQWTGFDVRIGAVHATVASNTSTVLTLNESTYSGTGAWVTPLGDITNTPTAAAYTITRHTGVVDVDSNQIECADEGYGLGGFGIVLVPGASGYPGMRVRVRQNKVHDCDADAIHLKFDASATYAYVEVVDNFAHDDQSTPTTTSVVGIVNAIRATKFILRNNVNGENVANSVTGLSAGTWLLADGLVSEWEGYGDPGGVVAANVGSTYHRRDGGAATTLYQKESGSGTSGWVAK